MQNRDITTLELHGDVEVQILKKYIKKGMDSLGHTYTRGQVIEFLTLQQIAARISPRSTPIEQEDGWLL